MHAFYSRYDLLPICIFHYFSCLMFLKCYLLLHHENCLSATDESLKQIHTTVATLILMFLPALRCSQTLVLIGKWKASQAFSADFKVGLTMALMWPITVKCLTFSVSAKFIFWSVKISKSHIMRIFKLKRGFMNGSFYLFLPVQWGCLIQNLLVEQWEWVLFNSV